MHSSRTNISALKIVKLTEPALFGWGLLAPAASHLYSRPSVYFLIAHLHLQLRSNVFRLKTRACPSPKECFHYSLPPPSLFSFFIFSFFCSTWRYFCRQNVRHTMGHATSPAHLLSNGHLRTCRNLQLHSHLPSCLSSDTCPHNIRQSSRPARRKFTRRQDFSTKKVRSSSFKCSINSFAPDGSSISMQLVCWSCHFVFIPPTHYCTIPITFHQLLTKFL